MGKEIELGHWRHWSTFYGDDAVVVEENSDPLWLRRGGFAMSVRFGRKRVHERNGNDCLERTEGEY